MTKTLVALLVTIAFVGLSLDASAQKQKCPEGKVWHPDKGRCVTPRGSR